ncbi:glycoside hydrolase family 2 protein [Cellulomonas aerilata]|uniref:Beta-galactosidase n=1 Tax=Cellulomonas aerilata TaxID=515326 RepID=A0A512D912_9CELL|nr:sugar-binding domain-containing protein [Cellulomonas aerilata]GEO32973.1 beta-galactosidase [Cellulomonas aerilata]
MPQTTVHPRPQLARERWWDLCGTWQFAFDDTDTGVAERWYRADAAGAAFDREILVPFPPESRLSGVHERGYHPVVWYRRTFAEPVRAAGERLLLHFGAVDYRADVWVNGQHVGRHEGGHTPFTADVTGALLDDQVDQVVVVRAEDRPHDVTQPRGKQDWQLEPHAFWYHRTTGIWQPVWLEPVPARHVTAVHWVPDLARASVEVEVRLSRLPERPSAVRIRLALGEELLADQTTALTDDVLHQTITIPAARNGLDRTRLTWSPESPVLIDAEVSVIEDGRTVDTVGSYLGLRSVGFADGKFLLNGRPYFLRLVLEQGYWPASHLAAPSADALRREVELTKELGFNGVRIHQKVEDPRYLYWCDRLGLVVWSEMPSAYSFSTAAIERVTREWVDVVRRDRSHPCIVTWVPLNESWGVADLEHVAAQRHYVSALYHLTKALDPSRPAVGNDGWEHTDGDIWGVHDYGGSSTGLRERYGDAASMEHSLRQGRPYRRRVVLGDLTRAGRPVVITEFGGLSFTPATGERWAGYATVGSAEELVERFGDLVGALLDSTEVAGFCYTQLTDTEQERNGLLTEDRRHKVDPARIRAVLNRPSRTVPAEEIDLYRLAAAEAARGALAGATVEPSDPTAPRHGTRVPVGATGVLPGAGPAAG